MKYLQKCMAVLVAGVLALSLVSCGGGEASPYTPEEMARVIMATQPELPALTPIVAGDEDFTFYLENSYLIDPQSVEAGAICYPMGFDASEVTVLRLGQAADVSQAESALLAYIGNRRRAFAGYAPEEEALAGQGVVEVHGRYVALLICADTAAAQQAFLACFEDAPPSLPPSWLAGQTESAASASVSASEAPSSLPDENALEPEQNGYDHDAVLTAWQSGDASALSPKNQEILTACQTVIETVITNGMSDYEKELAIHDWMVDWIVYDWEANNQSPHAQPDPDNTNPYAPLLHQKAICYGYASTFQLFMDLLEIECITVCGTANAEHDEHGWNMVRLDGEWYCVDVTWDDPGDGGPTSEEVNHIFFNVTSDFMRNTQHHWDSANVPEATATAYCWKG